MITNKVEAVRLLVLLVLSSTGRMIQAGGAMDFFGLGGDNTGETFTVDNTANDNDDENYCPLTCQNGSTCERGQQNLSGHATSSFGARLNFHQTLHQNGWYCSCPKGYTGLECQTAFQSCSDGERVCYHGGICKTDSTIEGFYGTGESSCDCRATIDSKTPIVIYSGEYCETATVDLQACAQLEYCLNDGVCQDDPYQPCQCADGYSGSNCSVKNESLSCQESGYCQHGGICLDDPEQPCECQRGYFGIQCQFAKEVVVVPECKKDCVNGGECVFEENSDANGSSAFLMRKQYCKCPESHYGEFCEHSNEMCGKEYCQNGGNCFQVKLSVRMHRLENQPPL